MFFDFFWVICSEISPIWFRKHFNVEEANKIKNEILSLADAGIISEKETYEMISKRTGIEPDKITQEWQELIHINEELVSIIKTIKKQYPVYLLSNAVKPFLERIIKNYDLYSLFDKVYISSQMKIAKPSQEFFKYVLNDLKLDPKRVVMIDDNPSNLKGAASCGIDGILFTSNDDFKREFDHYFSNN